MPADELLEHLLTRHDLSQELESTVSLQDLIVVVLSLADRIYKIEQKMADAQLWVIGLLAGLVLTRLL